MAEAVYIPYGQELCIVPESPPPSLAENVAFSPSPRRSGARARRVTTRGREHRRVTTRENTAARVCERSTYLCGLS